MARFKRITSFLIIFIFFVASSARAQTPPPGESPEAMGSRYQAEMEKEKKALEKKKVKPPKIEIEKEAKKPVPEGPSFVLKELTVTGATVFTPEELKPLYAPCIDKTVSLRTGSTSILTPNLANHWLESPFFRRLGAIFTSQKAL